MNQNPRVDTWRDMIRGHVVRSLIYLFCFVAISTLVSQSSWGQAPVATDVGPKNVNEAAKKSLGNTPWYDPDEDAAVPMEMQHREVDEANRQSRWNPKPKQGPAATPAAPAPGTPPATAPGGGWSGLGGGMFGYIMIGWICAGILIVLIYVLVNRSAKAIVERTSDSEEENEAENIAAKLEQLPIKVASGHKDLLGEALRLAKNGQLDQAIVYLFGHTLIQLDRQHRIRLAQGKTNRQYLREVGSGSELYAPTNDIVTTFEASYFGGHTPEPTQFELCVQRFRELERFLGKFATSAALLLFVLLLPGCGQQLYRDYGHTKGPNASQSLNGFTGIRGMYREYGWQDRDDVSLNRRLRKAKTLFWAPPDNNGVGNFLMPTTKNGLVHDDAVEWFDQWLKEENGRSIVFVVPSYDATPEYLRDMTVRAPPEMRLTYRRLYAKEVINQLHQPEPREITNDWFETKHFPYPQSRIVKGSWIDSATEPIEFIASCEIVEPAQHNDFDLTSLVTDEANHALIVKITKKDWQNSQVLVVAIPSSLVNYALTKPESRRLADQLITVCGTPGRIVFLEPMGLLEVRPDDEPVSRPGGLALFWQWPWNIAMVHASLIGFVLLFAIAPIFGRPKRIAIATRTDFGRHLTALGELLQRIGDQGYARRLISDYFVQVRSEPDSTWVVAPVTLATKASESQTVANPAALRGPFFNLAAPETDPPESEPPPSKPGESP